ncbi:hypothetical protein K440DRAFT_78307 [Wilcoxina mikolae CBS 423.85]|nr:hypothetical protein K440DRAFT_78307 [Wilcoxina mikolae CBS 423.85]
MPPITFTQSSLPPDVEITILSNVYHIHSTILRTCSRFFDKSLSSTWWKDENTHHHRKDGIVYCYELKLDEDCLESSMVEPVPPGMVDDTKNRMIEMEEEDGGSVVGSGSTYSSPNDVFRNNLRQWLRREALERLQYSYSLLFNILHHTFTSISIRWCHELSTYRDVITLAD